MCKEFHEHELCKYDLRVYGDDKHKVNLHYFEKVRNATKEERELNGWGNRIIRGVYVCKICGEEHFFKNGDFKRCLYVCKNNCNGVKHGNKSIVCGYNDLRTTHSDMAKEWHMTLNGDLLPTMVSRGYKKPVWWQCEHGHEWKTSPKSRTGMECGCPICAKENHGEVCRIAQTKNENIVGNKYPDLVKYFVNEDDTKTYTYGSHKVVQVKCPICGTHKLMEVASLVSQIISLKNGFPCDNKECENNKYHKMSVLMSGESNPQWQGGITPIQKYLRNLPVVTQWKNDVRGRENHKCQLTGKIVHGGNSDVHHLYAFNMIVLDAHRLYNINIKQIIADYTKEELKLLEDYVLEWHINTSNGVLLSEEVHDLFHSIYHKGSNTLQQFEEFKERYLNGEFDSKTEDVA